MRAQPVFFTMRNTRPTMRFTLRPSYRCKSETSSGVRVATGHQIPYEWTYITLGCFLRALTMTDRPRKDTDLSLFVGPCQPRSSSCIPSPPLPRSRSGHRILSGGSQQKRLSYLDSISVKFGQWNGLTGDCRRIWYGARENLLLTQKNFSSPIRDWHNCVITMEKWSAVVTLLTLKYD